jgi:hypothetical protein
MRHYRSDRLSHDFENLQQDELRRFPRNIVQSVTIQTVLDTVIIQSRNWIGQQVDNIFRNHLKLVVIDCFLRLKIQTKYFRQKNNAKR